MKARLISRSLIYLLVAEMVLGLATIVHGDCGSGGDDVQQCVTEKRSIGWMGLGVAAVGYAFMLLREVAKHKAVPEKPETPD